MFKRYVLETLKISDFILIIELILIQFPSQHRVLVI